MNKLFVTKIGGNVLDDEDALQKFLKDFASIQAPKILIHGGGALATKIGNQLGIESKYIDGRRITDRQTLDLVTMVYGGMINKNIVALLNAEGGQEFGSGLAVGLSGKDANLLQAVQETEKNYSKQHVLFLQIKYPKSSPS